jgi:hypothetical protein
MTEHADDSLVEEDEERVSLVKDGQPTTKSRSATLPTARSPSSPSSSSTPGKNRRTGGRRKLLCFCGIGSILFVLLILMAFSDRYAEHVEEHVQDTENKTIHPEPLGTKNPREKSKQKKPLPNTEKPDTDDDTDDDATTPKAKEQQPIIPFKPLTNEEIPVGFKKPAAKLSHTYLPRGKPITEEQRTILEKTWGDWTFVDPKQHQRPVIDFSKYTHRDIPTTKFPSGAWQTDESYLKEWLPQAIGLAERALEAILAEYGHSKFDEPELSLEQRSQLFNVTIRDPISVQASDGTMTITVPPYNVKNPPGNAGYTTTATLLSLRKRLLHAILTEDMFVFVMGGHSAAAGHGCHFQQSYTLQVQRIMEPILARMGVYHQSHNFAMGGLGTAQNCLAARELYGPNIDVLMWDSGMTEGEDYVRDLFARNGFLTLEKVPLLWGEPEHDKYEYKVAGAGAIVTGFPGTIGLPTTTLTNVEELPFAARYMKCDSDARDFCNSKRYNDTCWIPRDDDIQPGINQRRDGVRM